ATVGAGRPGRPAQTGQRRRPSLSPIPTLSRGCTCHTLRLGPQTTAPIQPAFYAELPFDSARPSRAIRLAGVALPELSARLISPLAGTADPTIAVAAARRIRELWPAGRGGRKYA